MLNQFFDNFSAYLLFQINVFDMFNAVNFFQISVKSQITKILIESNFCLIMYAQSIFKSLLIKKKLPLIKVRDIANGAAAIFNYL